MTYQNKLKIPKPDLKVPLLTRAQSESVSDFIQSATKFPKFVSRVLTRAKRVSRDFLILIIGFALKKVQRLQISSEYRMTLIKFDIRSVRLA